MTRVDLFGVIHKGLAADLFASVQLVAATDFSRDWEVSAALAHLDRLFLRLAEHSATETGFILPEIARVAPLIAADLRTEWTRIRGLESALVELVQRTRSAPEREVRYLGYRLHTQLRRLVAEELVAMEREETTANRALWAHLGDDELRRIRTRILASLPPGRLLDWAALIVPAVCEFERTEIAREIGLPLGAPGPQGSEDPRDDAKEVIA